MRILLMLLLLCSCSPKSAEREGSVRIVSLAPSITELLYYYQLHDQIAGFTEHCVVPEGVDRSKLTIGSMTPSLEKILTVEPTLVFTSNNRPEIQDKLKNLGIAVEKVDVLSFEDSMDSFRKIGQLLDCDKKAEELIGKCRKTLEKAVQSVNAGDKKVMLSISTIYDQPGKVSPWIAGDNNIYSDLLARFKVGNAYTGKKAYLKISTESLLDLDPDVIFILKHFKLPQETVDRELKAWKDRMPELKAVKNGNIYILDGDYMMLTGPRIPLIIRDFESALIKAFKEK